MNNHWTFTEHGNEEWVQETFYSKVDAIAEGRKMFPNKTIIVGQLKDNESGYHIENKEVI